jgi:hypothetical protein
MHRQGLLINQGHAVFSRKKLRESRTGKQAFRVPPSGGIFASPGCRLKALLSTPVVDGSLPAKTA